MADIKMCERCEQYYEPSKDKIYKFVQVIGEGEEAEEFPVNAIRIGFWTKKSKWKNLAAGNDICNNCMREICNVVFGSGSKLSMKKLDNMKRLEKVGQGRYRWANKPSEETKQGNADESE